MSEFSYFYKTKAVSTTDLNPALVWKLEPKAECSLDFDAIALGNKKYGIAISNETKKSIQWEIHLKSVIRDQSTRHQLDKYWDLYDGSKFVQQTSMINLWEYKRLIFSLVSTCWFFCVAKKTRNKNKWSSFPCWSMWNKIVKTK